MDDVIGHKIVDVRPMTRKEMNKEMWGSRTIPLVIVLDNGIKLYPSSDEEGNGPGALFGCTKNGNCYCIGEAECSF